MAANDDPIRERHRSSLVLTSEHSMWFYIGDMQYILICHSMSVYLAYGLAYQINHDSESRQEKIIKYNSIMPNY